MKWIISECYQLDSLGLNSEEFRVFREVLQGLGFSAEKGTEQDWVEKYLGN